MIKSILLLFVLNGLGKLFNWNGITANLGSINRMVANDLTIRKDNQNSENKFHSQGTIIGTGGMSIINRNNTKLDNSQTMRAVGPAVFMKELGIKKPIKLVHRRNMIMMNRMV